MARSRHERAWERLAEMPCFEDIAVCIRREPRLGGKPTPKAVWMGLVLIGYERVIVKSGV